MAKETVTRLLDDMEEGRVEADLTIDFALEGKRYEMELSNANALKLRSLLSPWIANARSAGAVRRSIRSSVGQKPRTAGSSLAKEQRTAIRDWARGQGMEVSTRGRLSEDLVKAYELAHKS